MSLVTERIEIEYNLEFESSFHFGTGLRNGLVHRAVARNKDEYLYMPGSTLKGVIRERCEQIAQLFELNVTEPHAETNAWLEAKIDDPDIVCRIFGSRFLPGKLFFDDAIMLKDDRQAYFEDDEGQGRYKNRQVETRTQVSLSRKTRTAKQGHLFTSEYGIRMLNFEGEIYGHVTGYPLGGGLGTYSLCLLLAGLKTVDRLGGNKSTGAGQVTCEIAKFLVDNQETEVNTILTQLPDLEYYLLEREGNQ